MADGTLYVGRFAPSPTGPLHAGSLVAALASWLDARAHDGQWLLRFEDVDTARCLTGVDRIIEQQLAACGLHSDLAPVYQSQRSDLYQQALDDLVTKAYAYPCSCSRKDIETALMQGGQFKPRHAELIYPGICRSGMRQNSPRAWRFLTNFDKANCPPELASHAYVPTEIIDNKLQPPAWGDDVACLVFWTDRRLGQQQQIVSTEVGDFVLKRADGCFTYQLAVVADDAAQGITDVVRGQDLADNTARQILLQRALGLPTPRYWHTPLVLGDDGEKLSKQNGAVALNVSDPQAELNRAARVLGLAEFSGNQAETLQVWVNQWRWKLEVGI